MAWKKQEYNSPTRSDYYLMQITATIRNLFVKDKKNLVAAHEMKMDLQFEEDIKPIPVQAPSNFSLMKVVKQVWMGAVGYKGTKNGSDGN